MELWQEALLQPQMPGYKDIRMKPFVCVLIPGIWLWALPAHSASPISFYPENFWKLEERVKVSHCLYPSSPPTLQVLVTVLFPTGESFSWPLSSAPFDFDFISRKSYIPPFASEYSLTTQAGTQFTLTLSIRYLSVPYGLFSPFIPYISNPSQVSHSVRTGEIKNIGIALKELVVHRRGDSWLQCSVNKLGYWQRQVHVESEEGCTSRQRRRSQCVSQVPWKKWDLISFQGEWEFSRASIWNRTIFLRTFYEEACTGFPIMSLFCSPVDLWNVLLPYEN